MFTTKISRTFTITERIVEKKPIEDIIDVKEWSRIAASLQTIEQEEIA